MYVVGIVQLGVRIGVAADKTEPLPTPFGGRRHPFLFEELYEKKVPFKAG